MRDDTTPQDDAAMSPASTGSVDGEPDAWMHVSGGLSLGVFKHVDKRLRHLCVPLYRHPPQHTLTDAEREAVRFCSELARMGERPDLAAALRGLLERLK